METFDKIYKDMYEQERYTTDSLDPIIFRQFALVSMVFALFVILAVFLDHLVLGILLALLIYLPVCAFLGIKNRLKTEKSKLTVNQFLVRYGIVNTKQVSTLIRMCDEKIKYKKYIWRKLYELKLFLFCAVF